MAEVVIDASQSGNSVRVRAGDDLIIRLAENPTTGFRWAMESSGEPALALSDSHYDPAAGGGIGAGGTRVLHFHAVAAGPASLRLALRQEWQPDEAIDHFQLHVTVDP